MVLISKYNDKSQKSSNTFTIFEKIVDKVKTMRLFLTVVQIVSLSGTGRQPGPSPTSILRHITALENGLGVWLLNRTSRRFSLTKAGQV